MSGKTDGGDVYPLDGGSGRWGAVFVQFELLRALLAEREMAPAGISFKFRLWLKLRVGSGLDLG